MLKMKKVCSWIAAAMMLISAVPQTMAAANAEAVVVKASEYKSAAGYSQSGDIMKACGPAANFKDESGTQIVPTLTYEITVPAAGKYDIWLDGTASGLSDYANAMSLGEESTKVITSDPVGAVTSNYSSIELGYTRIENKWRKAESIELESGTHKITVQPGNGDAYGRYWSVINRLAVVPAEWNWSPDKSDTPSVQEFTYLSIYASEYKTALGYSQFNNMMKACGPASGFVNENGEKIVPTLTYEIIIPKEGKYDIWLDGTASGLSDYANALSVGEENTKIIKNEALGAVTSTYGSRELGYTVIENKWRKAESVELESGTHKITVQPGNGDAYDRYWSVINRIAIVPASWHWSPELSETPSVQEYTYLYAADYTTALGYSAAGNIMKACGPASNFKDESGTQIIPTLTYDIQIPATGLYDIWVDGTSSGQVKSGANAYAFGNRDTKIIKALPNGGTTSSYNSKEFGYTKIDTAWVKADSVQLRKGMQTLKLTPGAGDSYSRYWSVINRVAVIPSDWNWSPNQSVVPKKINSDIIWNEAESISNLSSEMTLGGSKDAGSNAVLFVLDNKTDVLSGDCLIKFPKAGEYSIYAVASRQDGSGYSEYKYGINGDIKKAKEAEGYKDFRTKLFEGEGIHYTWQKLGDYTAQAPGYASITFMCDSYDSSNRRVFGLDMFAIVPRNDSIDLENKSVAEGIVELQKSTFKIADDLNNVTADLNLPTEFARDTSVVWSSSDESVVDASGKVTRGYEDKQITVTATFTVLNAGVETQVPVEYNITVPKLPSYEVTDFVIDGAVESGKTVTASAIVTGRTEEEADAVLIIAAYKDGRLMGINSDAKMYKEATKYSAGLILPDDVTGYSVRAFLWDTQMQPMAESL